jgi:hypothetical protein
MPDKKLSISATNAITDSVKNQILSAANVSEGAAKVVRDSNGKVVEVIIHLPESASSAAAAAIAATPGVANVEVTDIPEGTQGFDGTLEGWNTLLSLGYTYSSSLPPPVFVYNEDGTCTVNPSTPSAVASSYFLTGDGKCPSYPLEVVLEMKIKGNSVSMKYANDVFDAEFIVQSNALSIYQPDHHYSEYTIDTHDDTFHVYKAIISSTGLVTASMDDVEVMSAQLTSVSRGNYIGCSVGTYGTGFSGGAVQPTIDYIRWTKRP